MNVKLYGPRVLLEREKPKEKGTLLIPDNPNAIHSLARVVHEAVDHVGVDAQQRGTALAQLRRQRVALVALLRRGGDLGDDVGHLLHGRHDLVQRLAGLVDQLIGKRLLGRCARLGHWRLGC